MIIIDEAWKLLQGKDSASFIAELNRTLRKYFGSVVMATQMMGDFFREESPAVTEAFNNSEWKVIMSQPHDAITSYKSHAQLKAFVANEYDESFLKSIKSNNPHYSEMAIYGTGVRGVVGRLRLDPFSRILYSTNPAEFQAIEALQKQGYSVDEAIRKYLERTA